jgi:hypothetical protein
MKKKIKLGTKDTCKDCGKSIRWNGKYWEHSDYTPRHIATPTLHEEKR